jgi:hypothetical protein
MSLTAEAREYLHKRREDYKPGRIRLYQKLGTLFEHRSEEECRSKNLATICDEENLRILEDW